MIDPGIGNDVIDGGIGSDTVDYGNLNFVGVPISVTLVDNASSSVTVGSDQETLTAIENLNGNDTGNTFIGDSASNTFNGLSGNDTLIGAGGSDHLFGGLGDDIIEGGSGADEMDGGDDVDTLVYTHSTFALTIDLSQSVVYLTSDANKTPVELAVLNFENVQGGVQAETIIGSNATNRLEGGGGDDTLRAVGAGGDELRGGDGNDHLFASTTGGSSVDDLNGEAGDDDLHGGPGAVDAFGGDGNDTITAGAGRLVAAGGLGNDTITGSGTDDIIDGNADNDTLSGGGGERPHRGRRRDRHRQRRRRRRLRLRLPGVDKTELRAGFSACRHQPCRLRDVLLRRHPGN